MGPSKRDGVEPLILRQHAAGNLGQKLYEEFPPINKNVKLQTQLGTAQDPAGNATLLRTAVPLLRRRLKPQFYRPVSAGVATIKRRLVDTFVPEKKE